MALSGGLGRVVGSARSSREKRVTGARTVDVVKYQHGRRLQHCVVVHLLPGEQPRKAFRGAQASGTQFRGCFADVTDAIERAEKFAGIGKGRLPKGKSRKKSAGRKPKGRKPRSRKS